MALTGRMLQLNRLAIQVASAVRTCGGCCGWVPVKKLSSAALPRETRLTCAETLLSLRKTSPLIARAMTSAAFAGRDNDFIFRQLLDYRSYTYTYLLADPATGEAIIIDPVIDLVERDLHIIRDLGLNLLFALNTHVHADHITGTGRIKQSLPSCRSVIADVSGAKADVKLKEGDTVQFGKFQVECFSTPGHTSGCMTFVWRQKALAFTGDALLIRGCGRTDFQQGDASKLYDSVHKKILSLPENYLLYPAHDYTGQTVTTVAEERRFNPRLTRPREEFIKIMDTLNLPYPKQIDKALPANMVCGLYEVPEERTN